MTTKHQTLLDLAARVEGLDGTSREVDAAIKEVVGHHWDYAADWGPRGHDKPVAYPYTASLDTAMQLAPPDDSFTVGQNVHHKHWQASVNYVNGDSEPQSRGCSNATQSAATALTAAALKARAMMEPQDEN